MNELRTFSPRLVQAMVVLTMTALLVPIHHLPLLHFQTEWMFAVCAIVCVLLSVQRHGVVRFRVDEMFLLLVGLMIVAGWQVVSGSAAFSDALLFCAYIFLGGVFYQTGGVIAEGESRIKVVEGLAIVTLLVALCSCLVGALQINHVPVPFGLVYRSVISAYGNLAQSNHFNSLIWLGMASTLYLVAQRLVSIRLASFTVLCLMVFSVFSGSRSGLLYAAVLSLIPLLFCGGDRKGLWKKSGFAIVMLPLFALVLTLCSYWQVPEFFKLDGTHGRFASDATSAMPVIRDERFAFWRNIIEQMSFEGVGVGRFQDSMRENPEIWREARFGSFPEHAHNQLLDIGYELGWGALLYTVLLAGLWLWRRRRGSNDAGDAWAWSVALIIGIHAMLEYPLRYTYFLIPFLFTTGLLARTVPARWTVALSRRLVTSILVGVLALSVIAYQQFSRVDATLYSLQAGLGFAGRSKSDVFADLDQIPDISPFKRYASLIKVLVASPADIRGGGLGVECEAVVRLWMSSRSIANCAAIWALDGNTRKADDLLASVCDIDRANAPEVFGRYRLLVGRAGKACDAVTQKGSN